MQELVKTGKYTEINNNPMSTFGLIQENMELSHIHLTVADSTWLKIEVLPIGRYPAEIRSKGLELP